MKSRECSGDRERNVESLPADAIPQLPAWKAFVVQFSRDAGTEPGVWTGRVEHLSSGRRARFNTPQELLTILSTLLGELCRASVDGTLDEQERSDGIRDSAQSTPKPSAGVS